MNRYFADFHIHVGISEAGRWVKIPTSRQLTVRNILETAWRDKGLQIVGIVDALSPWVQTDLAGLIAEGSLEPQSGGGLLYKKSLTLLLGAEIETYEEGGGLCHSLLYLPDLAAMQQLTDEMSRHIRNIGLSSQNAHMSLRKLAEIVRRHQALWVPAHVFTPHKSFYGSCASRLTEILSDRDIESITAIELGLSADSAMADRIHELWQFEFLSNSDAHSPEKIAREYNELQLPAANYAECALAFRRQSGRRILANYGLDPRLGKYHQSCCERCATIFAAETKPLQCPACGSHRLTRGVSDRIAEIADADSELHPESRPTYHYQVPLHRVPGLGARTLAKLIGELGTEMELIHTTPLSEIERVGGTRLARAIGSIRAGEAGMISGGGGTYGKISLSYEE